MSKTYRRHHDTEINAMVPVLKKLAADMKRAARKARQEDAAWAQHRRA